MGASASDGCFLLFGFTTCMENQGKGKGWLVKVEPNGDTLWTRTYERLDGARFHLIFPTSDGNFLAVGFANTSDPLQTDGMLLKIKPDGDTLWTRTFGKLENEPFITVLPVANGNFLIAGRIAYGHDAFLKLIIGDRYAWKDKPFHFKIPLSGSDSLNVGYTPVKTPAGMTVSPGGTISWTPAVDSVYSEHVEYLVMNDLGKKDTLTFAIFVNSPDYVATPVTSSLGGMKAALPFEIPASSTSGRVKFRLPDAGATVHIFDITGKFVANVQAVTSGDGAFALWNGEVPGGGRVPAGRYFARVSKGKGSSVRPFTLLR
jgi:hypothetical protein